MQNFTRTELKWIIGELDKAAIEYSSLADSSNNSCVMHELFTLKTDNLRSISSKLQNALNKGNKRISIGQ